MISYWESINFKPETTDMNEVDLETDEKDDEKTQTVDQVKNFSKKIVLDTDMTKRYGGVVIKGFKKDSEMTDIVEILKEAGLPFDYDKEDFQIIEKYQQLTIYIHDLKPETCIEMINNLHGEKKSDKHLSVYSLVEDTPTKQLGDELETLIEDNPNDKSNQASNSLSKPTLDTSVTPASPTANLGSFQDSDKPQPKNASKFWNDNLDDLDISDDSSDDEIKEFFKRKADGSPETNEFEKTLSRKAKKKLKQLLNKSN